MPDYAALRRRIVDGRSDAGIDFDDLCRLLTHYGFASRIRGSHHLFSREGIRMLINLQRDGQHAKPYQVRQVRQLILEYGLGDDE